MKTTTNVITVFLSFLFLSYILTGCKGEKGDVGPQGAAGAAGSAGPAGPAGAVGNANVSQISYGLKTHDGKDLFFPLPTSLTSADIDKSIYYVYVKQAVKTTSGTTASFWFSVPGETSNGNEYSFYVTSGATVSGLFLRRVVNFVAGNESFDDVRIIVVPATTTIKGRLVVPHFSSYEELCRYYNLSE